MPNRRHLWGFSLLTAGLCAAILTALPGYFGIEHLGGASAIFYGGVGLIVAAGLLLTGSGLGYLRNNYVLGIDGLGRYVTMALAVTLIVGLLFSTLISASLHAAGVGALALLGVVSIFGIICMGGLGGTGHRAQWRQNASA